MGRVEYPSLVTRVSCTINEDNAALGPSGAMELDVYGNTRTLRINNVQLTANLENGMAIEIATYPSGNYPKSNIYGSIGRTDVGLAILFVSRAGVIQVINNSGTTIQAGKNLWGTLTWVV